MGLRLAAAVIFIAIGGSIGAAMADKLRRRCKRLSEIQHLLGRVGYWIGSREDDVYAVCRSIKKENVLPGSSFSGRLPDSYSSGENFHCRWVAAVQESRDLEEREKEILAELGRILGSGDKTSQMNSIKALERETERLRNEQSEQLAKKGKLYTSAGLLFGIMAGILTI
ncbi:MAG: stage III sporulation protein AB [Ruminococcus sp.]|nr:stage III sporulation protein AB [Ruminococcus sp.]